LSKIVDLHCDTISAIYEKEEPLFTNSLHFDIKRAMQASIMIQFFALFTMPKEPSIALKEILKQVDLYYQELNRNSLYLYHVNSMADINENNGQDRIGCILHLEGGDAIGEDPALLRILYQLGLRSMGLTWNNRNQLADGIGEGEKAGGLSKLGRKIVQVMDEMGILLDLSHIAEKGFFEALEYYTKPILVTHANARALCSHPRNLTDSQIKALAQNGGVIGVNQVSDFIKEGKITIDDLLDHIMYIGDLIGIEHVALGSDFDGADDILLPGIEAYAGWEEYLQGRGLNQKEIQMITRDNALRVISRVI
jgi:membrane dipeptidase